MKKTTSVFQVAMMAGLFSFTVLADLKLPIGAMIPKADLKLKDISGKEITLKTAQKDNGLLVMFSCNSCPVVIANQTRTKEICTYAASKNLGVVLLNANEGARGDNESLSDMQAYAKDQAYSWFYALDKNSELADAFGASRTPECYLFDKSGKLVYHGAIDDSPSDVNGVKRHHLRSAIDELVAGKNISVTETRSVGCSIRRG
ncbi:MAG TPA: thioredoxin family protein [Puia sp.]|nr:thioredoxin family protein [Puia sp.]